MLVHVHIPRVDANTCTCTCSYYYFLFSIATEVTTTFIFHDPSQLSALQDNGLPWIVLNSLINKKVSIYVINLSISFLYILYNHYKYNILSWHYTCTYNVIHARGLIIYLNAITINTTYFPGTIHVHTMSYMQED